MSKANEAIKNKDTFLQHVSLKNYKSIKDVEIDFKPGLNIIIGKNGSGKTNFINALSNGLNFNYGELSDSDFSVKALYEYKYSIEIQALKNNQTFEELKNNNYILSAHEVSIKINGNEIKLNNYEGAKAVFFRNGFYFNEVLIRYGIYYKETTTFISVPVSFIFINNDKISRELISIVNDAQSHFTNNFFHFLHIKILELYQGISFSTVDGQSFKKTILSFSEHHLNKINQIIFLYSPILAIRLNPDFNIIREDNGQKQIITNFYLEFLIDTNWLTFNLLSDGTKRLFYIISEMVGYEDNQLFINELNVILLEEPELGIHPHQLHQLMEFIKEQSKQKQIIITTHSPQVLDALEPDELDKIIICHSEPKTGTQLSHLTEQQIKKAKKYMASEAFLSDYWRFSDLEPA